MKLKYYRKPRPVFVNWLDASNFGKPWHDQDSLQKEAADFNRSIRTLGYLIGRDKRSLYFAKSVSSDMQYSQVFSIPRGFIGNIRKVK
jgi:hypothetical protein